MEWVEKAFFYHLNNFFEISSIERNHQVLLTDKNLQAMVKESQPFTLFVLPRLAPQTLVPDEHYILKDLPFYEVARATNSKVCQDCLEQKKKKHQDGTLRQAPTTNRLTSSSTVHSSAKKKGPITQPIQRAPTPPSAPPSPSISASSAFLSSFAANTEPDTGIDLLFASTKLDIRVELVVPLIAWEEEEEEDMDANLRVGSRKDSTSAYPNPLQLSPLPPRGLAQ